MGNVGDISNIEPGAAGNLEIDVNVQKEGIWMMSKKVVDITYSSEKGQKIQLKGQISKGKKSEAKKMEKGWTPVNIKTSKGMKRVLFQIDDLKKHNLYEGTGTKESIDINEKVKTELDRKYSSDLQEMTEKFTKIGMEEEKVKNLAKGIVNNKASWKKNFQELKKEHGGGVGTVYLRKEKTGLPFTLEMKENGEILVLLKQKLNRTIGAGTYKTVKEAYDLQKDVIIAQSVINIDELVRKEGYATRDDAINTIQQELKYQKEYGNIATSEPTFHIAKDTKHRAKGKGNLLMTFTAERASGTFDNIKDLEPQELTNVFLQVTKPLVKMHNDGLVHRDIKCENLMHKRNEARKVEGCLYDFGFCMPEEEAKEIYCGTPHTVAPEVLDRDTIPNRKAADVFSLGWTFYESITGEKSPLVPIVKLYKEKGILKGNKRQMQRQIQRARFMERCRNAWPEIKDCLADAKKKFPEHAAKFDLIKKMVSIEPGNRLTMAEVKDELVKSLAPPSE